MNIAMFSDSFYPKVDGLTITLLNFIRLLSEKGHKIKLYIPSYGDEKLKNLHENVSLERHISFALIGYPDFRLAMPVPQKISESLKIFKPDIIHFHTPGTLGIIGINFAERHKIPLIGTYHTYLPGFLICISPIKKIDKSDKKYLSKKIVWKLSNRLYNKCDLVTVPSESMKEVLEENGLKTRIIPLSNGLNMDDFSSKKRYGNKCRLLHVGRMSYEKSVDVIIKSVGILSKEFPDISLSLVGDGPALKSLKLLTEELGIEKNIHFLGFVEHSKLNEVYKEHDIFIIASTIETQGVVILEAMASGLPIIGVNKLAIPDCVKNNINGYITSPFNETEMAEKIKILYLDSKLRKDFGERSSEMVKEHDVKNTIEKLESIYFEYRDLKKETTSHTYREMTYSS
jgi:glycosyltransferase involved in cell wall biosynthesis